MMQKKVYPNEKQDSSSWSDLYPRLIFLLCMEHPLTPSFAKTRLGETGLYFCEEKMDVDEECNIVNMALENLRLKGILYRNPDGSYELNRCVEHFFRQTISDALASKSSGNRVEQLIRTEARNFISRARSVREAFEKEVHKELAPEYHDLSSRRARDIVMSLWDEIDHKRIYNSLHCIFDMLPIGIIDFGISKEEISLEERFFAMSDEQVCDFMIEQIRTSFEKHRRACEYKFRENRRDSMPEIMANFRRFLEASS